MNNPRTVPKSGKNANKSINTGLEKEEEKKLKILKNKKINRNLQLKHNYEE